MATVGQHILTHDDNLLVGYHGINCDIAVPPEYEHEDDEASVDGSTIYGLVVVSNLNDTDQDGTVDNVVGSFTPTEEEVDLVKIVFTVPPQQVNDSCVIYVQHLNPASGVWESTNDIRFWCDKSMQDSDIAGSLGTTIYSGSVAVGASFDQGGLVTVYAEVAAQSDQLSDYQVIIENRVGLVGQGTQDRIKVSGAWAELEQFHYENTSTKITASATLQNPPNSARLYVAPAGGPVVTLNFEEGDYITIYDDDHLNQGMYADAGFNGANDTARQWLFGKCIALGNDANGQFLDFTILAPHGKPNPNMFSNGDNIRFSAPKEIDEASLLKLSDIHAGLIGSQRVGFCSTGVITEFVVTPAGVMSKELANGQKVHFDVARRKSGAVYEEDNGVYTIATQDDFPADLDLPNDDIAGQDEDVVVPPNANFDKCFQFDCPGFAVDSAQPQWFRWETDQNNEVIQKWNFEEFVRSEVGGLGLSPNQNHDVIWGSRCSTKMKWSTYQRTLHDGNRQRPFPRLLVGDDFYRKPVEGGILLAPKHFADVSDPEDTTYEAGGGGTGGGGTGGGGTGGGGTGGGGTGGGI